MNARRIRHLMLSLAWAVCGLVPHFVQADTIYSTGFESSDGFTLNSALPSSPTLPTDWYRLDGNTNATTPPIVDINGTNHGGSQALRIANQGPNVDQNNPDSNTFAESPVINVAGSSNLIANNTAYVSVKWDMRVDDAVSSSDDSLYIGLDVYDGLGDFIATVGRQVIGGTPSLIGTDDTGFNFDVLGTAPSNAQWSTYELRLDYIGQTYQLLVDGLAIGGARPFTTGAEDSMDIDFADAGRGLDTAYFDNFSVTVVPEPVGAALIGVGMLAAFARRSRFA